MKTTTAFLALLSWANGTVEAPPTPPAVVVAHEDGPSSLHNPVAHMDITIKAYEVYAARYGGGELGRFIGSYKDGKPFPDNAGTVAGGAFDEDQMNKNPFGEMVPVLRHFWDPTGGPYKGYMGNDSSVNRARKYMTGGFGLDGAYDKTWKDRGEGAVALYRKGDKARAYWYLGHIAHLVEDATVPAHTLLMTHAAPGSDAYETYMKGHFHEWKPAPGAPRFPVFDDLYELFLRTAEVANDYDCGAGPGNKGRDGQVDRGARRNAGFTEDLLKEEASVLMPLAYDRVAALYVYFYKQVDQVPPTVTLKAPLSATSEVVLEASAVDDISGVDKDGYVFERRSWENGGWSEWEKIPASGGPSASFAGRPGARYEFRASATDAAGNLGRSM